MAVMELPESRFPLSIWTCGVPYPFLLDFPQAIQSTPYVYGNPYMLSIILSDFVKFRNCKTHVVCNDLERLVCSEVQLPGSWMTIERRLTMPISITMCELVSPQSFQFHFIFPWPNSCKGGMQSVECRVRSVVCKAWSVKSGV